MSTITLYLLHMKPILVKSLAYIFSGHSVGVWIYVTKCLFFERLAEWQQSGRQVTMVAAKAATSSFRQRCVRWPHFTLQNPLTCIDSCGKAKVYRTPAQCLSQIFILYL